ncbi:aldo/keto reductase [Aureispira sp. CCB-QB1]|uniref:aldo/keto reductase n=1 Tax=Aureispira sp. CCB-QB1 TaxID=1313421 RepID=UPI000695ACD3|nr:aldo/keto reductase [Aureispira sp. CCB-QB1]
MVNLKDISSVGVGTYRMNVDNEIHFQAIKTAVEAGYNLIDTATNYQKGKSEELIGHFLKKYPEFAGKLFIISKAGYFPPQTLQSSDFVNYVNQKAIEKAEIEADFAYSLDPNFIAYQLESSLKKIGREYLDAYLLHNPERLFQSKNLASTTYLYQAIERAFKFLEKKVVEGKIRYYGISSGALFDPSKEESIDFEKLLSMVKSIQENHHFKVVQFPFNFKEQAALQKNYDQQSLLDLIHKNGLIAIGNRPLNMNDNGMEFRLVTHEKSLEAWKEEDAQNCLNDLLTQVESRIKTLTNGNSSSDDFEPMVLLKKHYTHFYAAEAVETFFQKHLLPFLQLIYEEETSLIEDVVQTVKDHATCYAHKNQTTKTKAFLKQEDIPLKSNSVLTACDAYLNHFHLNHILVGLRKPQYVMALEGAFTKLM